MSARLELGRAGSGACCVALRRRDSLVASEDAYIPVQGIDETLADSLLLPRGAMAALGLSEHQVMEVRLVGAHSLRAVRSVRLRPLSDGFMEAAAAVGVARAVAAVLSSACAIAPGCSFEAALPVPGVAASAASRPRRHDGIAEPHTPSLHTMQVLECDPPGGGVVIVGAASDPAGAAATSHASEATAATFTLGAADLPAEPAEVPLTTDPGSASGHRLGGRRPSTASTRRRTPTSRAGAGDAFEERQSREPAPPAAPRLEAPSAPPASVRRGVGARRPVVARHGSAAEPSVAEPSTAEPPAGASRQRTPPRGRPAVSPAAEGVSVIAASHAPLAAAGSVQEAGSASGRRSAGCAAGSRESRPIALGNSGGGSSGGSGGGSSGEGGLASPSDALPIRPGSSAIGRLRGLRRSRAPPSGGFGRPRVPDRPHGVSTSAPSASLAAAPRSGHPGLAQPSAALPDARHGRAGESAAPRPGSHRPESLTPAPPAALPAAAVARPQSAIGRRLVDGLRAEFAVPEAPATGANGQASGGAGRRPSSPSSCSGSTVPRAADGGGGSGARGGRGGVERRAWAGEGHRLGSGRDDPRPPSPVTVSPKRRQQEGFRA